MHNADKTMIEVHRKGFSIHIYEDSRPIIKVLEFRRGLFLFIIIRKYKATEFIFRLMK